MTSVQLAALPDVPCRLKGDVKIVDRGGQPLPERGSPVCLCRSAEKSKSFCEDSHEWSWWKDDA